MQSGTTTTRRTWKPAAATKSHVFDLKEADSYFQVRSICKAINISAGPVVAGGTMEQPTCRKCAARLPYREGVK